MALEKVYVALDVETTGDRLGVDSMLSLGACVVTREAFSLEQLKDRDLTFYAELKPTSLQFVPMAVRVGASQLGALKSSANTPSMYPTHSLFEARKALRYLQDSDMCVLPETAMRTFAKWLENVGRFKNLVPVVDTTFFDSGWLNLYFARAEIDSPLGHKGLDLTSFWKGASNNLGRSLNTVAVCCGDLVEHHALYDAVHLARLTRTVFFEKLGFPVAT